MMHIDFKANLKEGYNTDAALAAQGSAAIRGRDWHARDTTMRQCARSAKSLTLIHAFLTSQIPVVTRYRHLQQKLSAPQSRRSIQNQHCLTWPPTHTSVGMMANSCLAICERLSAKHIAAQALA